MPSQTTTKEKNLKLHIWRTLGPLLLKYAPKTQDLGARLWLPPWVAFKITEPSTHGRGQLPATVQGSPKWAFSPDLTALLSYLPQPLLQWLLCVPSSPQGHCRHKREKTAGTPSSVSLGGRWGAKAGADSASRTYFGLTTTISQGDCF